MAIAWIITHPEDGILVGMGMGFAFFSLKESAGQTVVVTFSSEAEARECVAGWNTDIKNELEYKSLETSLNGGASINDLIRAGMGHLVGRLLENVPVAGTA